MIATLKGTEHLKITRVVDGGFDAKDVAMFVVELDGMTAEAVFDSNALRAVFEIADDFAFKSSMDFASQKAHDVGGRKSGHAVVNQSGIDVSQSGAVSEQDVRGPFTSAFSIQPSAISQCPNLLK